MKRAEQLQPLSRQHHNGLLAALLLKKGLAKESPVSLLRDFVQYIWSSELNDHFRAEEDCLLPALQGYEFPVELINRLLNEHASIRRLVLEVPKQEDEPAGLEELANLLESHIRFEERIFFPRVEALMPPHVLQQIGACLPPEEEKNCMNFPHKFWE